MRLRRTLQLGMPVVIMPAAPAAMGVARASSLPRLPDLPLRHPHPLHPHPAPAPAPPSISVAATGSRRLPVPTSWTPITFPPATAGPALAQRRFDGPAHRPATRTHATPVYAPLEDVDDWFHDPARLTA